MSTCIKCGGEMIGDGYTTPLHCENAQDDGEIREADAAPVYCDFVDEPTGSPKTDMASIVMLNELFTK